MGVRGAKIVTPIAVLASRSRRMQPLLPEQVLFKLGLPHIGTNLLYEAYNNEKSTRRSNDTMEFMYEKGYNEENSEYECDLPGGDLAVLPDPLARGGGGLSKRRGGSSGSGGGRPPREGHLHSKCFHMVFFPLCEWARGAKGGPRGGRLVSSPAVPARGGSKFHVHLQMR